MRESGKIDIVAETLAEYFNKDEITASLEQIYNSFDQQKFQNLLGKALAYAENCKFQLSSEKLKEASQIQDYFETLYIPSLDPG